MRDRYPLMLLFIWYGTLLLMSESYGLPEEHRTHLFILPWNHIFKLVFLLDMVYLAL